MGPDTTLNDPMASAWAAPSRLHRPAAHTAQPARAPLSRESRWALGGMALALAMVAVFYLLLAQHVAQLELKRAAAQSEARERHSCALIRVRLMRDQCLATLSIGRPVEVLAPAPKTAD